MLGRIFLNFHNFVKIFFFNQIHIFQTLRIKMIPFCFRSVLEATCFQVMDIFQVNIISFLIHQKGMYLNHDFYVVVDKQCRTEN